jgi:hypothetical protein
VSSVAVCRPPAVCMELMADLSGREGGSILNAWSAQARRWLPWLPRQAPPTPVPSGTGLLSVLDAAR